LSKPEILLIDIETTPIEAYSWGPKWEANLIEFKEHSRILSFSAKRLNGSQVTKGWVDYPGYKPNKLDDKAIVQDLWDLLNGADIVVTQNGKQFDIKMINSRFAFFGLKPPAPYKVVDTKIEAKKYLRLPSYSLDDLCDYFGFERKMHHEGFPMWVSCMAGDKKAWKKMLSYNSKDVRIMEKVYLRLLPWMSNHPNIGMYTDKLVCPSCGSGKLQSRGFAVNKTTRYKRVQCVGCGAWSRVGPNLKIAKPAVSL